MYLRTPKRYTPRGRRRNLISLRWAWLYMLAPVIIIAASLVWYYRADLSRSIGDSVGKINIQFNAPTVTPTLPARDLEARLVINLSSGSINDALDAMSALTDSLPNEDTWHPILAQTLIMRARNDPKLIEQAAQAGQEAINANPESPEGWAVMALVLDWSGDPQKGLGYALRAKELGDTSGLTQAVIGGIYISLGDYKQAAASSDEALKANSNLAYGYYVKGQIAGNNGDTKEAITMFRQALDIAKADKRQWGGYIADALATAYRATSQTDQAVAVLTGAIPLDKDYPVLYGRLAEVYIQGGDFDKANESAQSCIDHDKNYAYCFVLLAKTQYSFQQWEKVTQSAGRAIDLGTQETSAYYYGGYAYYKLNRCADATKWFNEGMALADRKNKQQAKKDFAAALADCGVIADAEILPTPTITPTPRATVPPTLTPRKR